MARLAACAAVVLAVTAIVLAVHVSAMQGRLSAAQQRDSAIAAVIGARDATTLTAPVRTGGTATVVMSHRTRTLVFIGNGLARLPASKAYELWLMGPAGATPAGMLASAHHGMTGPCRGEPARTRRPARADGGTFGGNGPAHVGARRPARARTVTPLATAEATVACAAG